MGRPRRVRKASLPQCRQAIMKYSGRISHAAQSLGMTYGGLFARIKNEEKLQTALSEARETLVDTAESELKKAVKRGEWQAVQYTLDTLGKQRGFTRNPETVNNTQINIVIAEDEKDL